MKNSIISIESSDVSNVNKALNAGIQTLMKRSESTPLSSDLLSVMSTMTFGMSVLTRALEGSSIDDVSNTKPTKKQKYKLKIKVSKRKKSIDGLVRVNEIANEFSIVPRSIYAAAHTLKSTVRVGRAVYVNPADLREALAKHLKGARNAG